MRKIIIMALATISLYACTVDDEDTYLVEQTMQERLQGRWYNHSSSAMGETILYGGHELCGNDYIDFENGTYVEGDVTGCNNAEAIVELFQTIYTLDGDRLIIGTGEETETFIIQRLNDDVLELGYYDDWNGDQVTEVVTLRFKRSL